MSRHLYCFQQKVGFIYRESSRKPIIRTACFHMSSMEGGGGSIIWAILWYSAGPIITLNDPITANLDILNDELLTTNHILCNDVCIVRLTPPRIISSADENYRSPNGIAPPGSELPNYAIPISLALAVTPLLHVMRPSGYISRAIRLAA